MASLPARRGSRRVFSADVESDERRGWLSYGLAALGISALGLAVAAALPLTTNAQTTGETGYDRPPAPVAAPKTGGGPDATLPTRQAAAIDTFARRANPVTSDAGRSAELRTAIVKEQAAQRAEELAKEAEDITQAARAASSDAWQKDLTAACLLYTSPSPRD